MVQWSGPYEEDPKKLLASMLKVGVFDYSAGFKDDELTHVGVACSCNPFYGSICMIVAANNPQPKKGSVHENWMPLMDGKKCAEYCTDFEWW